jgi:phosphoadenosine phosphosulfate reductase
MSPLLVPRSRELTSINARLGNCTPAERIRWALSLGQNILATTSMGRHAAATLHALSCEAPGLPIVWIDHGFHTQATHATARTLRDTLDLNLQVFRPAMSAARIEALFGGIPTPDQPAQHQRFTDIVKLEPFRRALRTLESRIWISGIRRDQTAHRGSLDIVTIDDRGLLKVAPFFDYDHAAMVAYLDQFELPRDHAYFDPTKFEWGRECGLHLAS